MPNVEISKVLTNRTVEQIKCKRKILKIASKNTSPQEVAEETERESAISLIQAMR